MRHFNLCLRKVLKLAKFRLSVPYNDQSLCTPDLRPAHSLSVHARSETSPLTFCSGALGPGVVRRWVAKDTPGRTFAHKQGANQGVEPPNPMFQKARMRPQIQTVVLLTVLLVSPLVRGRHEQIVAPTSEAEPEAIVGSPFVGTPLSAGAQERAVVD